jgi:hypothetical protein
MRVVCGKIGKFCAKFEDFKKIMANIPCHSERSEESKMLRYAQHDKTQVVSNTPKIIIFAPL